MGLFGSNIYIMSIISHRRYNFESSMQYYFGDLRQGSTENISECNNLLELSVYNMWCSNMVLTNAHLKFRIEFIIMQIFMKIVKICPKSPRFTVHQISPIQAVNNLYIQIIIFPNQSAHIHNLPDRRQTSKFQFMFILSSPSCLCPLCHGPTLKEQIK